MQMNRRQFPFLSEMTWLVEEVAGSEWENRRGPVELGVEDVNGRIFEDLGFTSRRKSKSSLTGPLILNLMPARRGANSPWVV